MRGLRNRIAYDFGQRALQNRIRLWATCFTKLHMTLGNVLYKIAYDFGQHAGESMVTKVLSLINGRLKFLYRKQKFLDLFFVPITLQRTDTATLQLCMFCLVSFFE